MAILTKEKEPDVKEITIELAKGSTYVAPDLTTIFHKDTPYTMEEDMALEYLSKTDSQGIPYFKRWVDRKKAAPDPELQGEVIRERGKGVRIVRKGSKPTSPAPTQGGEFDTAEKAVRNVIANASTDSVEM